jgi:hypothetical protein
MSLPNISIRCENLLLGKPASADKSGDTQGDSIGSRDRYVATLLVDERPRWQVEIDANVEPLSALRSSIAALAKREEGVPFAHLVTALQGELRCGADFAFALALEFVFPSWPLGVQNARFRLVNPKRRGRPVAIDELTRELFRLAEAWMAVTGLKPRVADRSYFVRAVEVSQPYLPRLRPRDGSGEQNFEDMRALVRRELKKLDVDTIELNPSTHLPI